MKEHLTNRAVFRVGDAEYEITPLASIDPDGALLSRLPYSLRILLENLLRHEDGLTVTPDQFEALLHWDPAGSSKEIAFTPARVLLQDFTGVPAIVDLAAMRDAMRDLGGDPAKINPLQPVELVIDHSIQVDAFGSPEAFERNAQLDFERNRERYAFLRWGQRTFDNFAVVPPNTGIVHQVNLEYLARVVFASANGDQLGRQQLYPDTLVGTDSHTTMVNGLGVLGWGVGGIEAEAAMLGQPFSMLIPQVIGVRIEGALREGVTSTDLVLTITQMLRRYGVVGKFVEFFGPGVSALPVADRSTIGNMSPEYGATCAVFPVDEETLRYLRMTGRPAKHLEVIEGYMKQQGLFHRPEAPDPTYTEVLPLDLASVEPSIAGPRRPQDRVPLSRAKESFVDALPTLLSTAGRARSRKGSAAGEGAPAWGESRSPSGGNGGQVNGHALDHGAVVIAAITSCTNTSNPSVMLGAGLLARNAARRGLKPKPWVKTSLAPGSKVVTDYFKAAGLMPYLDQLGFQTVGYGCTTCIGNSGPLPSAIAREVEARDLVVCAALSGNRNFEGRINSQVRANYLMSPPLVVAYALAGRMDVDLEREPLGEGADGQPVFLRDIWPSRDEVRRTIEACVHSDMFLRTYANVFEGDEKWKGLDVPESDLFAWDPNSTYVRQPPYFLGMQRDAPEQVQDLRGARALAVLGDSISTDHISPAGSIGKSSPAGRYLVEHGVSPASFNSYGARRGNHEVMVRGTFANVRLRNRLAPGTEGGVTIHLTTGEQMSIYEAAMRYEAEGTPLLVIAGEEYGSGSSRDWAAKGPKLLGVRAVLAESFERIHRSNLVGMGILPLQFQQGQSAESLGLTGHEVFDITDIADTFDPRRAQDRTVPIRARHPDGQVTALQATVRIDTPQEALYYRHGGILQFVVRQLLLGWEKPPAESRGPSGAPVICDARATTDEGADEQSIQSFPASDPPTY